MGAEIFRHDQQSLVEHTKTNGVETVLAVRRAQVPLFLPWIRKLSDARGCTSSLLGASACATGPHALCPHTHTHTRTQSSTLVFDWGPKGEKVLDALIDSLTAGYSIFEFSGAVSTDARNPGSDQLQSRPGLPPSLLCRLFSQRSPVPHVCMWVCLCGCEKE